jgi:hypothetical protein
MCIGVLHHLRNQRKVLEKLLNATKKGGKLFVWVYGKYNHVILISIMDSIRRVTRILPMFVNKILAHCMSVPAFMLTRLLPGAYFKQLSGFGYFHFYSIILDQLLPSIATYYTEKKLKKLISNLSLKYEKDTNKVGWLIKND